jgi:hypothetical protein
MQEMERLGYRNRFASDTWPNEPSASGVMVSHAPAILPDVILRCPFQPSLVPSADTEEDGAADPGDPVESQVHLC